MAQPPRATKRPTQRKRSRKRKRRDVSSSSSSSDSSDSSSEADAPAPPTAKVVAVTASGSDSGSGTTTSDATSSSSDTDEEEEGSETVAARQVRSRTGQNAADEKSSNSRAEPKGKARVPSPPPLHNVPVPTITDEIASAVKEQELKARFRQFWMGSVAEAFADDLNEIRKVSEKLFVRCNLLQSLTSFLFCPCQEPNMTQSRLGMLIDSLAAGADVYSSRGPDGGGMSEMEIVLGE